MSVSTQLRLITKAPPAENAAGTRSPATSGPSRPLRGRVNPPRRSATRRPVHWEHQWRLDERTRAVGRAGVASARAALAAAAPRDGLDDLDEVRRAS